jgi:hypothetical protein
MAPAKGPAYLRCAAWVEERFSRQETEPEFEVTPAVLADLVQVLNDTLDQQRVTLAEATFNEPKFNLGHAHIGTPSPMTPLRLSWNTISDLIKTPGRTEPSNLFVQYWPMIGERADLAIEALVKHLVIGLRDPIYLPASRTGFMLTYRSLAEQLSTGAMYRTQSYGHAFVPDLTRPVIEFFRLLVGLRSETGAYPHEADILEEAMGGRLAVESIVGLPEVLYDTPDGKRLVMGRSSSLVTELAPVILTLRHVSGYRVLIIEEPEAHLHPRLQRKLAQVIVRLIRKGLFVWITTHSENFCQQINNFMKLGAHPRRAEMQQKYGYEENDYLDVDDVGGYQFAPGLDGRTVVTEIEKTPQGLIMPTFNRELALLADQALDLELPEGGA